MKTETILQLCQSQITVTSELAKDSNVPPSLICDKLFHGQSASPKVTKEHLYDATPEEIEQAYHCGKWGKKRPSILFLQIFANVLKTLQTHLLQGVCSPSLLGSNGVCPLTVIATIPDICRHTSNLIVRAQHEVFIATNYWMKSEGVSLISNAIRELNRRAGLEKRRVVIKVLYDRGDMKQLVNNHQKVSPEVFADPKGVIQLPDPKDIPNIDIEVVNYHRPIVGTFHAKFMCVDRRIGILQSNNTQDNDNLEMMTQFEGDIVDSIYDMALISWHNQLHPTLPLLASPATGSPLTTFQETSFQSLFGSDETSEQPTPLNPEGNTLTKLASHASNLNMAQHTSTDPHYDDDIASEILRATAALNPQAGETRIKSIARLLNGPAPNNQAPGAPELAPEDAMTPMIPIRPHDPFPIAMVNRPPHGAVSFHSIDVPQDAAFISALRYAEREVFIQTPDLNAQALIPEILAACRRGIKVTYYYCLGYNDAGELLPHQGGHNEGVAHKLLTEVGDDHLDNLNIYAYVAKDQIRPIHNKLKKRSCHIKLLIADGHIGIQGSGNQDTQSWYHSQEANVMIDSELVCSKWMEGIRQNQNTHIYGKVEKKGPHAGCWVDAETNKQAEMAIGVDPGKFAWAKGVIGAVERVRGIGGF